SLIQLGDDTRRAEFLLGDPDAEPGRIAEGVALCREALGRYRVLDDPSWASRPLAGSLRADDRRPLPQGLRGVLALWARAEGWRAGSAAVAEQQRDALERGGRLIAAAESCYGPDAVPRALVIEKAELARLAGRDAEARGLREQSASIPLRTARERLLL